jgi:excisionase family DNA binding protein
MDQTKEAIEVSVEQAASILGTTSRTVLNYISLKQIKATKVGKSWFIDRASLEYFAGEKKKGHYEVNSKEYPRRSRRSDAKNVTALACYRLSVEAFSMPVWQSSEGATYSQRLIDIKFKVLEHLGAGYYSFGTSKRQHYDIARGLIGSAVALLYSDKTASDMWKEDLYFLENDLLMAFTCLLRKIERMGHRDNRRDYGKLTPPIIKAIQEQQLQIEALKSWACSREDKPEQFCN